MKNILIYLMIFLGFSLWVYAEDINECKTDIYYGNGVWNEYEDAEASQLKLQTYVIESEIVDGDSLLQAKYGNVKLAYNWGQGAMLDLLETYYQLREAGQVSDLGFFQTIWVLSGGNAGVALGAIASQKLMEPFTKDWEQGNVDEMWQKYYDESFKLSHKVLLVSHSQGNLFANRIYGTIDPVEYKEYFANVQVASPANEVKAIHGDHVTLFGDPIINPIPGSMSANAQGFPGHAFAEAYLNQIDPYTMIVDFIKQQLQVLDDSTISQWSTNQESNKNTCNYRITVKHRFDPTIEMPLDVYPFAPNQKLYQVGEEWVKASCGGKTILGLDHDIPEWDGKQDNECYMIDNPQKEKIISGQCAFKVSINNAEETCYKSDTFKQIGYSGSSSFPYGSYTFQVSYDDTNTSWTACRHCTNGWTNSHGDRLEIGNGAGGQWIHGGINLFVDVVE